MNIADVNAGLGVVNAALPLLTTAFGLLKMIWLKTNPGKTEQDYLDYLQTSSTTNITDSAAILQADGFVEGPPGVWTAPTPAKG